jgi:outer membrane protein TolC
MKRAGAAIAALLTAGCAWEKDARRGYEPIVMEHRLPKDAADATAVRSAAAAELERREKWTVTDCIDLAYLHSDDLKARGEEYWQVVAEKDRVLSEYLPRVDLRGALSRDEDVPTGSASRRTSKDSSLRVSSPLFSGLREYHSVSGAGLAMDSAADTLRFNRSRIALAVAEAFYDVLQFERASGTLESGVETQKTRRDQMRERVDAGVSRRTELLLVEAQLAQTEARLARAKNDLMVARERLSTLVGGIAMKPLDEAEAAAPEPASVEALQRAAWDRRRDLAALDSRRAALEKQARAEEGSWLPELDVSANLWLRRDRPFDEVDWDVRLDANWNLFEGGGARARLAAAKSRARQAEHESRALRLRIGLEVKEEFYLWKSIGEDILSLEKEVAANEENHRLLQEEYGAKLATNLEVELARDLLLNSRLALDRARLEKRAAWYRILFVTGQLP